MRKCTAVKGYISIEFGTGDIGYNHIRRDWGVRTLFAVCDVLQESVGLELETFYGRSEGVILDFMLHDPNGKDIAYTPLLRYTCSSSPI